MHANLQQTNAGTSQAHAATPHHVRVWDLPVRIGHWLLVAGVAVAWASGEREAWALVHATAGSLVIAVIVFRLFWGLAGSSFARFDSFVRGPAAVHRYLRSLLAGRPTHYTGHNPAGGWAIVLLLAFGLLAGASGWLTWQELGGEWLGEAHEALSKAMLLVIAVHVGGVIIGSRLHHENLARAMINGRKIGSPDEDIGGMRLWAVPLQLAWALACIWWLLR